MFCFIISLVIHRILLKLKYEHFNVLCNNFQMKYNLVSACMDRSISYSTIKTAMKHHWWIWLILSFYTSFPTLGGRCFLLSKRWGNQEVQITSTQWLFFFYNRILHVSCGNFFFCNINNLFLQYSDFIVFFSYYNLSQTITALSFNISVYFISRHVSLFFKIVQIFWVLLKCCRFLSAIKKWINNRIQWSFYLRISLLANS